MRSATRNSISTATRTLAAIWVACLQLIAEKHLKFIARPGPLIGDHWRNAGYPAWLLAYSDYKMDESAIEAGLAPPDAEPRHARGQCGRTRLAGERNAHDLRPPLADRNCQGTRALTAQKTRFVSPSRASAKEKRKTVEISGPLLFVALDDAVAIRTGAGAPDLSRYLSELRRALARGGLDAASFMNVPDVWLRAPRHCLLHPRQRIRME